MMKYFIIAFLLFLAVNAKDVKCVGNVYDPKSHHTYQFDLSRLHHDASASIDTLWYRTNNNTIYYVNFCGQTAAACESDDTSVCMRIPGGGGHKYVSGGSTSTQTFTLAEDPRQSPSSSVTVTYSNGEKCGNGYFTTKIYVNCQQTAEPGYFYNADDSNPCETVLYMWSAAGCGKDVSSTSSSSSSEPSSSSSSYPQPDYCSAIIKDDKNRQAYFFNLSTLHHDDSTYIDTLWYRTDDNTIYYVNFCGQTASACESDDTSVCMRVPSGYDYSYLSGGSTSTQTISIAEMPGSSPSTSVTVTYSNGDKCSTGNYKTKIYVNCQPDAVPGFFYNIDRPNDCEATLYLWSAAGCGKKIPYIESSSSSA